MGLDIIHFIMKYFAKLILHPLVRPFVLLFFGLTSTASLAMLFRVKIGLDQTLALPKVRVHTVFCSLCHDRMVRVVRLYIGKDRHVADNDHYHYRFLSVGFLPDAVLQ